jgi:O-antigen/teichoic acid export membrane protein
MGPIGRRRSGAGGRRVSAWATIAGLEAVFRLVVQVVMTAILARLLTPDDFGATALVLTLVTIFNVFVAVPFEEPLAQRKHLRGAHVRTALAASWAAALVFLVLSVPAGQLMGWAYDAPVMGWLLPVASLLLLPNVALVTATALARRRRAFNAIALASLIGNLTGAVAAVALGLLGAGLWALIAFRVVTVFAQATALVLMVKMSLRPAWSAPHHRDLRRFAWFVLWDRLTDNLTYLLFNYLVGGMFGLSVLGHFNMAMRVIEPIRGAVLAIAHNLSFSLLLPIAHAPVQLADQVRAACRRTALVTAPVFFGIAAVAPLLIPVLAGPGWDNSIRITEILGVGAALVTATQLVITGLSVKGMPQYSLWRGLMRLVVITLSLVGLGGFGAVAVGATRLLGDLTDTAGALWLGRRKLGMAPWALSLALIRPLAAAALMAVLVALAGTMIRVHIGDTLALALSVGLGIGLYPVLLAVIDRDGLRQIVADIGGRLR